MLKQEYCNIQRALPMCLSKKLATANFRHLTLLTLLCISFATMTHAQKMWDGGGGAGNNFWDVDANWDPDGVPAAGDDVDIPANFTVIVRNVGPGALARSIDIGNNSTLEIVSGTLLVDNMSLGDDGIEIMDNAHLKVTSGMLTIQNIDGAKAIYIPGLPGSITIGSTGIVAINNVEGFGDGIYTDGTSNITIKRGGSLNITDIDDGGSGIHYDGIANSTMDIAGTLTIDDIDDSGFGILVH